MPCLQPIPQPNVNSPLFSATLKFYLVPCICCKNSTRWDGEGWQAVGIGKARESREKERGDKRGGKLCIGGEKEDLRRQLRN
ncbi:hypothetical protein SLEP1_g55722 [Rubroshorea leprosula]|uniref:Uncharacterized protein n=1 Tax=Rubroshorea leprosula TaxID=152421 RepID=A0AAV5MHE1_9ROSI|nr:hypothetical protein SLEP1_g55722 [Rubroshorea leprosula]